MKYYLTFVMLVITGNIFCVCAQPAGSNEVPKSYAIVIGITSYQNPAIPALQYADKDALQFAAWLQSKAGGQVANSNIKLLLNSEATIAAIYNALDWLKEQCKENDNAYIYFSGHGDVETQNNYSKGYLLAYNSPQNNYANNAVRVEDFNDVSIELTTKNKARIIIVSDACHSGKLAGDFFKGRQLVASALNRVLNDQVRLASCREDELAAEGPNWGGGRGVFSYYLILGLQGFATIQNDSTVRLHQLSRFLDSAIRSDRFLAQSGHIQNPVTDGNPNYTMSVVDKAILQELRAAANNRGPENAGVPTGLMALRPLTRQPIDYFFS